MTNEEIISILTEKKSSLKIKEFYHEEMKTMIFRDRDYPDGDDTCKMILYCILDFKIGNQTFVLTNEGKIYSFSESGRTNKYIYGKHENEVTLKELV